MNIYSLTKEYVTLWELLEESQGELTPELESYLDSIGARSLNALFNLQDLREEAAAAISALKEKMGGMKDKISRIEKAEARLKQLQISLMDASGQKTMTNGVYKITLTQNPVRVEVDDEEAVPDTYKVADVKISVADLAKLQEAGVTLLAEPKIAVDKRSLANIYKTASVEVAGARYVREANVRVS